jgi:putative membrane protein
MFEGPERDAAWQHGLFALLIVVAVVIGVVLLTRMWLLSRPPTGRPASPAAPPQSPALTELDVRYARGEITREEYLQRRSDLLGHFGPPPTPPPPSQPAPRS